MIDHQLATVCVTVLVGLLILRGPIGVALERITMGPRMDLLEQRQDELGAMVSRELQQIVSVHSETLDRLGETRKERQRIEASHSEAARRKAAEAEQRHAAAMNGQLSFADDNATWIEQQMQGGSMLPSPKPR